MNTSDLAFDASQQLNSNGYFETYRQTRVAIGWDPAQRFDNSAIVICESVKEPIPILSGDPLKGLDPKKQCGSGWAYRKFMCAKSDACPREYLYPDDKFSAFLRYLKTWSTRQAARNSGRPWRQRLVDCSSHARVRPAPYKDSHLRNRQRRDWEKSGEWTVPKASVSRVDQARISTTGS